MLKILKDSRDNYVIKEKEKVPVILTLVPKEILGKKIIQPMVKPHKRTEYMILTLLRKLRPG